MNKIEVIEANISQSADNCNSASPLKCAYEQRNPIHKDDSRNTFIIPNMQFFEHGSLLPTLVISNLFW